MKKTIKILLLVFFFINILLLTGCGKQNDEAILKEKVSKEIEYLETELVSILNSLNNIKYRSYSVTGEALSSDSEENTSESTESANKEEQTPGKKEESSKNSEKGEENQTSKSEESKTMIYEMTPNAILTGSKNIDWNTLKTKIEILYSAWPTILIDLYQIKVNDKDILDFSNKLDYIVKTIKDENKIKSAYSISELYSLLTKYMNNAADTSRLKNIYKTKNKIIESYALVEEEKWDEVKTKMSEAENEYMQVLQEVSTDDEKQYNIKKVYVQLKEMQTGIDFKDKDIYYINYKNLMNEIGLI